MTVHNKVFKVYLNLNHQPLAAAEPMQEAIPVDVDQRLTPKQVSSSKESLVDDGPVSPYDVIVEQPMSDLQAEGLFLCNVTSSLTYMYTPTVIEILDM